MQGLAQLRLMRTASVDSLVVRYAHLLGVVVLVICSCWVRHTNRSSDAHVTLMGWHRGFAGNPIVRGRQSLLVRFEAVTRFFPVVSGVGQEFLQPLNPLTLS